MEERNQHVKDIPPIYHAQAINIVAAHICTVHDPWGFVEHRDVGYRDSKHKNVFHVVNRGCPRLTSYWRTMIGVRRILGD